MRQWNKNLIQRFSQKAVVLVINPSISNPIAFQHGKTRYAEVFFIDHTLVAADQFQLQ